MHPPNFLAGVLVNKANHYGIITKRINNRGIHRRSGGAFRALLYHGALAGVFRLNFSGTV